MRLCAYKISDKPITEISYNNDQLAGSPKFIVVGTGDQVPVGYKDVSNITNWHKFGTTAGKDYKVIRKEITILASTIGWTNLSVAEKKLAAEYFAVSQDKQLQVIPQQEILHYGLRFHQNSSKARKARMQYVEAIMYAFLGVQQAFMIISDVKDISEAYVNYGVEGVVSGDVVGLFDYIVSTPNTPFDNDGFMQKGLVSSIPIATIRDMVMDVLVNGNYK